MNNIPYVVRLGHSPDSPRIPVSAATRTHAIVVAYDQLKREHPNLSPKSVLYWEEHSAADIQEETMP